MKGYTKRNTAKTPRASHRGHIVEHSPFGRVILTITHKLPDGSSVEMMQHATKGFRVYHTPLGAE